VLYYFDYERIIKGVGSDSHLTPFSFNKPFGPVPQRMNFLWGVGVGQENPPIKALLRMVQHLRYDPHLTNCDTLALVLLVRDSVLANESIKKELAFRCCEPT
jgi:hypothetical protein